MAAWDYFAPETLSHATERGLANKYTRPLVVAGIGATALHLLHVLPKEADFFSHIGSQVDSWRVRHGEPPDSHFDVADE